MVTKTHRLVEAVVLMMVMLDCNGYSDGGFDIEGDGGDGDSSASGYSIILMLVVEMMLAMKSLMVEIKAVVMVVIGVVDITLGHDDGC